MAAVAPAGPSTQSQQLLDKLGQEKAGVRKHFYLVTFSRVLPETLTAAAGDLRDIGGMSRKAISTAVRLAFNDPLPPTGGGGRPREEPGNIVRKLIVFMEEHDDGSRHFHVAVYLYRQSRWEAVKRTLRVRNKLAAHFSCSHDFWWSVLRYGTELSKKDGVDDAPDVWLADGEVLNMFEESQERYQAKAFVARREKQDVQAAKEGKAATFTKLDFTSIVLARQLDSRSQVLRYVQDSGTVAMQLFVNKHQKLLNDYLEDAYEWSQARAAAEKEDLTDWALLCKAAEQDCAHGADCRYRQVAEEILEKNDMNFSRGHLANSIRKVINMGPCKEARVPFLVGPTNTGKSTLMDSVDDLFHWKQVFHLPADTDHRFALRNWVKGKRFVYFDEYSPVEYADHKIISATTFKKAFGGKYFEVQCPKNFSDGNVDFKWNRGVIFTNKEEGLWEPTRFVSKEDISHMKSRVELFRFSHQFHEGQVADAVIECRCCFAKWIVDACAAFDASQGMNAGIPLPLIDDLVVVANLDLLLERAKIPKRLRAPMLTDVAALGAADAFELTTTDWEDLPSWPLLKALERRRILTLVTERV